MVLGIFSGAYATTQDNNGGKTIYVAKTGTDRNDGLTPDKPKLNIESAIKTTNPGDTIFVGPGTYLTNLKLNENITLIGSNQENTIIEAYNDNRRMNNCIRISTEAVVKISNFTIKNGKCEVYNEKGGSSAGGGIQNRGTLTLENTTITNNTADLGAGIYNGGIMNISKVIIKNNDAFTWAGGIYNDGRLIMEDTLILNNTARWGGGLYVYGKVNLSRVLIRSNHAREYGGGVSNRADMIFEDSAIIGNSCGEKGGGILNEGTLYLFGSSITDNRSPLGGGIYNDRKRLYIDNLTMLRYNIPNDFDGIPYITA
jgi:hypothetical protein